MTSDVKKYWATFNGDGFPSAFYVSDVWPIPPDGVTEITQDQWYEFINNSGLRKWVNGEVVIYTPPTEPSVYIASPMQARIALLNAGLLTMIENAIVAKGGAIQIKWEYATEIRSDDPDLVSIAADLGIANQLPALFESAANVK